MITEKDVFAVNIQNLYRLEGILPFSIFVRLNSGELQKVLGPSAKLNSSLIDDYVMKGLEEFYVLNSDRDDFLTTIDLQMLSTTAHKPIDTEALKGLVDELSSQTLTDIFSSGQVSKEHLEHAKHVVDTYVALSVEQVSSLPVFLALAKGKAFYLRHSLMTSIFSILLARAVFGDARDTLGMAGLAGLLHDVGMARLPKEVFEFDKGLKGPDLQLLTQHPTLGVQILKDLPDLPQDVIDAVLQHHEAWDGRGYPNGLSGADIHHLARIVAVADYFGSMISQWGNHLALTPQLAGLMLNKNTHLDPQLVTTFKSLLNLS